MMNTEKLINDLKEISKKNKILTQEKDIRFYKQGKRVGSGEVLAVVIPNDLITLWKSLQLIVKADCIVIMQAANTGLTGGSTPFGTDYDRPIVIISTQRLQGIQLIDQAQQVVCLPGATLDELEKKLTPFDREPHSVIGSSCIGASVLGGVCNNSGGALVRRGPAYTEYALYAQINQQNDLELVNHLGINLGEEAEEILTNLQNANYAEDDIQHIHKRKASYENYQQEVSQINEDTPARFNANPKGLFEASGSAGKLCVFAVRLDTFKKIASDVFYIGTNNPDELTAIRKYLLTELERLPIAGEYIHQTAYDIGKKYGKDVFLFIEKFGTDKVPKAFALKDKIDSFFEKIRLKNLADRLIQGACHLFPDHLPKRMNQFRERFEHHLILRIEKQDVKVVERFLTDFFQSSSTGDYFLCDESEGRKAFLHRFAIAGAAIRYRDCKPKKVETILALDIALRRNDEAWIEELPEVLEKNIIVKIYYGHFLCHVFHQDYILKKGANANAIEEQMCQLLDQRGAEYPAEHNVGHMYVAKEALKKHYQTLDPTNSFNVGIGMTSKKKNWQ